MFGIVIAVILGIGCWGISYIIQPLKNYINRGSPPKTQETTQSKALIDYSVYELSSNEKAATLLVSAAVIFMVAFIFYKDILIAFLCSTSCFYFLRLRRSQLLLRRKAELNDQFKQALFSLSSSLSAGRSFENSIVETVQDLQMLYANPQTYIIVEFNIIVLKLRNGENVEAALKQFSERADMDDIRNFSDVLTICKRSGGNLVEVIRRTASMIGEKIELQQDISFLVAQKRFESRILSFAPLVIVALLNFSSPDYMLPLYEGIVGHSIMTLALVLLFLCFTLTNKIMNIQVQSR
ncbi:pilus assembly protein TadB [Paenibacillus psychroresistens]|uniref:Pilus assembly protein TadB n=1 Tax=Paenibacillus psychroresistens TaxID=1778678 RepID=A0A6B8RMB8_9BACL|nr:type II secretion system F family protein [Paenibacillus psychroresistens]QGQ96675.1 pilus assembly protein TadB [Paenibacillus psychroresistens]